MNTLIEIINDSIQKFLNEEIKLSDADYKWLERTGKRSYGGGTLQPIIYDGVMVGGLHWEKMPIWGIDYIEFKPEYQGKGYLGKVIQDNAENGMLHFISASDELQNKLKKYGTVTYDRGYDITTVHLNK